MLCQRKYALDLIEEQGLLEAKLASTPIDYNHKTSEVDDFVLLNV